MLLDKLACLKNRFEEKFPSSKFNILRVYKSFNTLYWNLYAMNKAWIQWGLLKVDQDILLLSDTDIITRIWKNYFSMEI